MRWFSLWRDGVCGQLRTSLNYQCLLIPHFRYILNTLLRWVSDKLLARGSSVSKHYVFSFSYSTQVILIIAYSYTAEGICKPFFLPDDNTRDPCQKSSGSVGCDVSCMKKGACSLVRPRGLSFDLQSERGLAEIGDDIVDGAVCSFSVATN